MNPAFQPPDAPPATEESLDRLAGLLEGRRVLALTGAGCSTESGIPDYRGPGTLRRARRPVQFRTFMRDAPARARYWARSAVGWPRFSQARPNAAHHALAALERDGAFTGVLTQNVDGLHQSAGSRRVVELHGALSRVRCLDCGALVHRDELQSRLTALNPDFEARAVELAPDGDAELPAELVDGFHAADCGGCAGTLKPDVVFFGENVPPKTVERSFALVEDAGALLVVGSSLAVHSGLRYVRRAAELGRPIALVNLGESRGDAHASVHVHGRAGDVLPRLRDRLRTRAPSAR